MPQSKRPRRGGGRPGSEMTDEESRRTSAMIPALAFGNAEALVLLKRMVAVSRSPHGGILLLMRSTLEHRKLLAEEKALHDVVFLVTLPGTEIDLGTSVASLHAQPDALASRSSGRGYVDKPLELSDIAAKPTGKSPVSDRSWAELQGGRCLTRDGSCLQPPGLR
mmetsp:Transcript_38597/g.81919  ORF Transcript_38597/g.81919 Transcript_38597/m.81919 type:complete len:165 (-) Transcript_38597:228-722(-)